MSSFTNRSAMVETDGRSFTGVSITVKVLTVMLFESPPSLTFTVTVAVPLALLTVPNEITPLLAGLL